MADVKQTDTTQGFVVSVGQTLIQTEEQALEVYYQMQSYPELQKLLSLHALEITKAIQSKDTGALINIIQKVQSDFLRTTAELPDQIRQDTEKKIIDAQLAPDEITKRVDNVKEALGETYKTAESVYTTKRKHNQEFIEKLVKNYSKLTPAEVTALTSTIVATAETYPELSSQQVIQTAIKNVPQIPEILVRDLQKRRDVTNSVAAAQKNDITTIEQQIIQAVLESPEPTITIQAIQTHKEASIETPTLIKNAQTLATASSASKTFSDGSEIDYSGFFVNISKNGSIAEKALAPLADTVFSLFPQKAQEAVVLKVLGSSWNKEISNNTFLQKTVGPLFQSQPVQQAITKGNTLFQSSGKSAVFTRTQSFFADIFVTVFHPQVSEVYLQLAGVGNTQMGSSISTYYAGWLASQGATAVAKKGIKTVGGKIASKAAGTAAGKVIGGLLGSAATPVGSVIGAFVGDIIIDKLLGGLWKGAKKAFGFLTLDWLGKLMSGQYESGSVLKDPTFIIAGVLVGTVMLLFVIPFILPLSLGGNAVFQKTVQNSAYIQGLGTGDETGPAINCADEPNNPLCSMESCDALQQDCRWPTSGTITQGPYTSCGGTHSSANAIDIGTSTGTDVYATIEGVVTDVFVGCADNEGSLGNICGYHSGIHKYLGNHIVIQGTGGYTYTLTFGHLLSTSIKVTKGQMVKPTDVVAEVDHSGSSSGPHLHFSFKDNSGQNRSINSILPFAIDHCVNGVDGCSPCSYPIIGG